MCVLVCVLRAVFKHGYACPAGVAMRDEGLLASKELP